MCRPSQAQPADPEGIYYPTPPLEDVVNQMGGLTLVSLDAKDVPLTTVLSDIARQTGIQLEPGLREKTEEAPPRVTLKIDKAPFWMAVRALTLQTGTLLHQAAVLGAPPRPDVATPMPSAYALKEVTYPFKGVPVTQGPFLLIANSLRQTSVTAVRFDGLPEAGVTPYVAKNTAAQLPLSNELQDIKRGDLYFSLFIDPKLSERGTAEVRIESAVDEKGKVLQSSASYMSSQFTRLSSDFGRRLAVPLTMPPDVGRRIASLSGTVSYYRPRQSEKWEFADALQATKETRAVFSNGITVTYNFESVRQEGENYLVRLRATVDLPPQPRNMNRAQQGQYLSARHFTPTFQLFDSSGTALTLFGMPGALNNGSTLLVGTFRSDKRGGNKTPTPKGPFKLVIEMPKDFAELQMPFEFKNLPLP